MASSAQGLIDLFEGKTVTKVAFEDGCIIFHLGRDSALIAIEPMMIEGVPAFGFSIAELSEAPLQ